MSESVPNRANEPRGAYTPDHFNWLAESHKFNQSMDRPSKVKENYDQFLDIANRGAALFGGHAAAADAVGHYTNSLKIVRKRK